MAKLQFLTIQFLAVMNFLYSSINKGVCSTGLIKLKTFWIKIIIIYKIYTVPYITCKKVTLKRLTINNSMDVTDLHL